MVYTSIKFFLLDRSWLQNLKRSREAATAALCSKTTAHGSKSLQKQKYKKRITTAQQFKQD